MNEYTLPNADGRMVQFTGTMLSTASSQRPDALRWTEITIYRTQAGKYVVHKVGRTVVFHRPNEKCTSGVDGRPYMTDQHLPCPKCKPDRGDNRVMTETDRHTVHITETADGVVECAHTQDDDGTTYLTRPARSALERASEQDPAIHSAYYVQRID